MKCAKDMNTDYTEEVIKPSKYAEMMDEFPILFRQRHLSMMETCMCWGIECSDAWYQPIYSLCQKLEGLNVLLKSRKLAVEAAQVKEKFGTLRVYYDIRPTNNAFRNKICSVLNKMSQKLSGIKYDMEQYVVKPERKYNHVEDIPDDKLDEARQNIRFESNAELYEINGKWVKCTHLTEYAIHSWRPTKHKILYSIMQLLRKKSSSIYNNGLKNSSENVLVSHVIEGIVDKWIRDAEEECSWICEDCGCHTHDPKEDERDYKGKRIPKYEKEHQRVITDGWVSYICAKCAKKRNDELKSSTVLYSQSKKRAKIAKRVDKNGEMKHGK